MPKQERIVAYKVWKCVFCNEVRDDSTDMWKHLMEAHGIKSVETFATRMCEYTSDGEMKQG
jgi:hypothetical protein